MRFQAGRGKPCGIASSSRCPTYQRGSDNGFAQFKFTTAFGDAVLLNDFSAALRSDAGEQLRQAGEMCDVLWMVGRLHPIDVFKS